MSVFRKLLLRVFAMTCFILGVFCVNILFELHNIKLSWVIQDQVKKSAIELNVDASGGNNHISSSEVYASILACVDDSVQIYVGSHRITYNDIRLARTKGVSLYNKIPSGDYVPIYQYDANGAVVKVIYNRV